MSSIDSTSCRAIGDAVAYSASVCCSRAKRTDLRNTGLAAIVADTVRALSSHMALLLAILADHGFGTVFDNMIGGATTSTASGSHRTLRSHMSLLLAIAARSGEDLRVGTVSLVVAIYLESVMLQKETEGI